MTPHPIDTEALRARAAHVYRHGGPPNAVESLAANTPGLLDLLAAAEHRIARLEAQSDIRGRAAVMYRERAREAEARIKAVQDAADIWDEGWEQGTAYVTGMERGADDDDLDHAATNPYRATETA